MGRQEGKSMKQKQVSQRKESYRVTRSKRVRKQTGNIRNRLESPGGENESIRISWAV